MIYLVLLLVGIIGLGVFLVWWKGIQDANHEADRIVREYVNRKTAIEAEKETALEKYYKQHPKVKP